MVAHSLSGLRAMLSNFDNRRRTRVYCREIDPLESYTENELRSRYRFGRESLQFIIDLDLRRNCLSDKKPLVVSERTGFNHAEILCIGKFS